MSKRVCFGLALLLGAAVAVPAAAQVLTPVDGGLLGPGSSYFQEAIDNRPGDQTDPHVSGDVVSYTDFGSGAGQIRYFNYQFMENAAIVGGDIGDVDTLSSVDGTRIAFSRRSLDRTAIIVFDVVTQTSTEVDSQPGSQRNWPAIGGSRVAFVDNKIGNGALLVHDLATHVTTNLSAGIDPTSFNRSPNISSDGNTVVWSSCDSPGLLCDVYAAYWRADLNTWQVPPPLSRELICDLSSACHPEPSPAGRAFNADTDGTWIVYESNRASLDGPDIYLYSIADGKTRRLALPGIQRNPSVDQGVIAFESKPTAGVDAELFVYVIATNRMYRITDTPGVDESLNDVTVLPNGDVRVVWAVNDAFDGTQNVYANTFTPPSVLTIDDAAGGEGDAGVKTLTFTVSLLPPSNETVTVDYATYDGTATVVGGDYLAAAGTLTFGPGETSKTIAVYVNGDPKPEGDETFRVVLSNPNNAVVALNQGVGTGTIVNDDGVSPGDIFPPTTVASAPPRNANGWYSSDLKVTLTATDDAGGSGVAGITYGVNAPPSSYVASSTVRVTISAEGTSLLTYFAVDNAGNAEPAKTTIVRIDRSPPVITVPSPITTPAAAPAGATVLYNVSAADLSGLASPIACTPASGSVFPVGTTTVQCAAIDLAGNTGTASFPVTIKSAATQIGDLIGVVNSFGIAHGIANSFNAKLRAALDSLNTGNVTRACRKLNDFIAEVRAQTGPQPGKALTPARGQQLIAAATTILGAIGC